MAARHRLAAILRDAREKERAPQDDGGGWWRAAGARSSDEIRKSIGVDEEGWVRAEDFEERYDRYRKVKEWMSKGGTEGDWPFSGPMVDEGGTMRAVLGYY